MGAYTFRWAHPANEVFVTGTFDNWSRSVKLEQSKDGVFEKKVELPQAEEKVLYKFIVDGNWATDGSAPQEDDGNRNINNVLHPGFLKSLHSSNFVTANGIKPTTKMSDAPQESSFSKLAGGDVPDQAAETFKSAQRRVSESEAAGPVPFTMSNLGPESTTAQLAKDVPLEPKGKTPGGFPETPGETPGETVSVNPLPATGTIGNPVKTAPGEKVPEPSSVTSNNLTSGVSTDKAGYEKDASDPAMLAASKGTIGTQPVQVNPPTGAAPFMSSVAPVSTTAGLAGAVPLEKNINAGAQHTDVPDVVKKSIQDAHVDPEATTNVEAVEEKKEVEHELLQDVKRDNSAGEPAPIAAAGGATTTDPTTSGLSSKRDAGDVSPRTKEPAADSTVGGGAAAAGGATTTTTGQDTTAPASQPAKTQPTETQPSSTTQPQQSSTAAGQEETPQDRKKKNRLSGFFTKLKEKLK